MVLGLLILTSIPVVTGVAEAMSAQKTDKERKKDAHRMRKFNVDVYCEAENPRVKEVDGHRIVLKDDRLWLGPKEAVNPCKEGYVAEAFYLEYPDNERKPIPMGLVSQVQDDPPLLNWIYIDKDTMEVKYGNKSASKDHYFGPWDWTEDEEGIVFEKEEPFMAVEDPATRRWQVYVDAEDDGLKSYVPRNRKKMQISLERTLVPKA